jgi:hypothetical protein
VEVRPAAGPWRARGILGARVRVDGRSCEVGPFGEKGFGSRVAQSDAGAFLWGGGVGLSLKQEITSTMLYGFGQVDGTDRIAAAQVSNGTGHAEALMDCARGE